MSRRKNISSWIWHVVFWVCLFLLYLYVFNARFPVEMALRQSAITLLVFIPLTYFNIFYLIPRFFERKNKTLYIICLTGIILLGTILIIFFDEVNLFKAYRKDIRSNVIFFNEPRMRDSIPEHAIDIERLMPGDSMGIGLHMEGLHIGKRLFRDSIDIGDRIPPPSRVMAIARRTDNRLFILKFSLMRWSVQLFQTAFILLVSTVYCISQLMSKKQKEALILESEKLSSELKFLKSQINPHFLFNALNNIYTLSIIKSDKTPDVVIRLSDMLKYIIYETETKDLVSLQNEIRYIENFIAIFKLKDSRINDNVSFNYDVPEDILIAPMILIPFIENAFKHSKIEDVKKGWIEIQLQYEHAELIFSVKNSIPTTHFEKDKVGGIGVTNVKRRLELIYPNRHELLIDEENNVHSVLMKIKVSDED